MPKVYIIIVNWNGWKDTIECLESVFRMKYDNFCVVVCDNGSSDESLARIAKWANGEVQASSTSQQLRYLTQPPHPKPIPYAALDANCPADLACRKERLLLIQTGRNLGFAGANNVGLRVALKAGDLEYAWLLNNDTVVAPDALSELVTRMKEEPRAGICGSSLLYYDDGKTVQALGGARYSRWTARVHHIGEGLTLEHAPPQHEVEKQLSYVVGASMLIRRAFLEDVGLMNERYFLFFEEIDWITRARGHFRQTYSSRSVVYHKQGRSTGEGSQTAASNDIAGLYGPRSRILYTRIHHPIALLTVILSVLASAIYRLMTGRLKSFKTLMAGAVDGASVSINSTKDRAT